MPELTVSMPAYNTGKYIGEAIESVLRQDGVSFELIVVDDGSEDNTAEIVQSFQDPRIKLIRNEGNMGIAYCHNLVIEQSNSPYIAHVDSDDFVLPGAFRKMCDALISSPSVGQVHCNYIVIDETGSVLGYETCAEDVDYRREILIRGGITNHLRIYKRDVFGTVGIFNENLRYSVDSEMALRIIDKFEIRLVPEHLYCRRLHNSNTSQSLRFRELRFWYQRFFFSRQLCKTANAGFLNRRKHKLNMLLIIGLYVALRRTRQRTIDPILNSVYKAIVRLLSHYSVNLSQGNSAKNFDENGRVAYYLWNFPVLSETFIQREVAALRRSGVSIKVVADSYKDLEFLDETAKALIHDTHYLLPLSTKSIFKHSIYFFFTKPGVYLKCFFFVITHRYEESKTFAVDRLKFYKAVSLAGFLLENKVTHLHSPWANRNAFTALIASRLLGVPFSVQGRASDIHRKKNQFALSEKFTHAEFVITNTKYNESYIKSISNNHNKIKIHTIYEGLNLEQFTPARKRENKTTNLKILTVGRLIEEKGLTYLLKACRILKDEGYSFRCNVIGGVERQFVYHYIGLMRLHRELKLDDCVLFLGAKPFNFVLKEYKDANIFVLPCVVARQGGRDISPNSLIEAMAMKLPVISTTIAAIPEIVQDGISGVLVPPNDENALAEALKRLINDVDLRRKLGENARKTVEEKFDIRKNIVNYVDLFERTR